VVPPPHNQPDPFRALETDSEQTRAWQAGQNAAADRVGAITAPLRRGMSWFRVYAGPLVVADSASGPARTLVDPGQASLDWFFPSPRGTFVAYGISARGDEQSTLHVVETASRRVLPDRIPFTSNAGPSCCGSSKADI
jgi:prolyl oligopeptidase